MSVHFEIVKSDSQTGDKYKVCISTRENQLVINRVEICKKGKRKYFSMFDEFSDFAYRQLNTEARKEYKTRFFLDNCPRYVLYGALEEAWAMLKPERILIW